jgi:hypothetical protein
MGNAQGKSKREEAERLIDALDCAVTNRLEANRRMAMAYRDMAKFRLKNASPGDMESILREFGSEVACW